MQKTLPGLLTVLVLALVILQIGQIFQIPILNPTVQSGAQVKEEVLKSIRAELPGLVIEEIGSQIHELVMDKIKLSGLVSDAALARPENIQYVLRVGSQMINREDFTTKFQEFLKKGEVQNLPKVDQKKEFVKQLKKHYAVLEDCYNTSVDQKESYKTQFRKYRNGLFLTELLKSQIQPITVEDVKTYYDENLSLYEVGDSYSFQLVEGKDQNSLVSITTPQSFRENKGSKQNFQEQPESQVPYSFRKALEAVAVDQLTPVLRYLDKFYVLLKTALPKKIYTPIQQAAPFIQERLTYMRIRELLAKLANPLKFQFPVSKDGEAFMVSGKPLPENVLAPAREVFPKGFFTQAEQSPQEIENIKLELHLIQLKYHLNPLYFPEELHKVVEKKGTAYSEALLIQEKQQELRGRVGVEERELKTYYESNKKQFVQSEGQLVSHIFQKEKSTALEVLNMVLMDPRAFEQIARERSEEPRTASRGGDMRYLAKEDISAQMNHIAGTLKEGEIYSQLVPSAKKDGFHIIRFVRKVPARVASFKEVRERLSKVILTEKRNRFLSSYMTEVSTKYPIQVDETLLSKL